MYIKKLLVLAVFLCAFTNANACEVCGCTIGAQQFGIIPQFNRHFVGLRYGYRSFHAGHGAVSSQKPANEFFHSTELWGRVAVGSRWQFFGFIPYQVASKEESYGTFNTSGVGDISVLGMYSLLDRKPSGNGRFLHNLQVGAGVKLPTGSHDYRTEYDEWFPGLQNGTGSVDFLINSNYILRSGNLGASLEASYRINTTNKAADFQYGNRVGTAARAFYIFSNQRLSVMPSVGLLYEHADQDIYEQEQLDLSGGSSTFLHVGVDVFTNNFSVGLTYQPTVSENLADGFISTKSRVNMNLSYFF